ncbi:hypothetical protein B9P78_01580 [Aerococcus sp. 1KP-2016]|nr:hypothetical protein B9P78_01580 [Aerococcus sp. 1KP-2016]
MMGVLHMLDRDKLLAEVATLYYEENLTQAEIAKKMFLSRPTISHMLTEAKKRGIVTITINHTNSDVFSIQNELEKKYGIETVLIADKNISSNNIKKELGILCAKFVESRIDNMNNIGLGWGTTVNEYVNKASFLSHPTLEIIPMIGGVGIHHTDLHSNHLAFRLSEKYNCQVSYFYAPVFAESIKMRDMFISSSLYQEIYQKGINVDLAILGVGNPIESSTYKLFGYFTDEEIKQLKNSPAIGDILGSFFDIDGNVVKIPLTERMVGINLEDIHKIKEKLIMASGIEKFPSILTLLKLNIINHLIIDKDLAQKLLESPV